MLGKQCTNCVCYNWRAISPPCSSPLPPKKLSSLSSHPPTKLTSTDHAHLSSKLASFFLQGYIRYLPSLASAGSYGYQRIHFSVILKKRSLVPCRCTGSSQVSKTTGHRTQSRKWTAEPKRDAGPPTLRIRLLGSSCVSRLKTFHTNLLRWGSAPGVPHPGWTFPHSILRTPGREGVGAMKKERMPST